MTIALSRFMAAWDGASVEKTCKEIGVSPAYINRSLAHPDVQRAVQKKFRENLAPLSMKQAELVAMVAEMVMTGYRRVIRPFSEVVDAATGTTVITDEPCIDYVPLDNASHAKYVDQLFKVMGAYKINVNVDDAGKKFLRVQTNVPRGPKDQDEPEFL